MSRLLVLVLCVWRPAVAFNLLPSGAVVLSPPARPPQEAHFGYSVALATIQGSSWVIVSAPRANSSFEAPRFSRSGALFRCEPTGGGCKEMYFVQGETDAGFEHPLNINNGTLGGSMDALLGNDGMVVCNPAYKEMQDSYLLMPGMCYWLFDLMANDDYVERRRLVGNVGNQAFTIDGISVDDHGSPQIGFSVHQLQEEGQTMLIGGPGLFAGRGTVSLFRHDFRESRAMENYGVAVSALSHDSYFGYAVTAGKFQPSDVSSVLFVGSAPRADDLRGKVLIFNYKNLSEDIGLSTINIKKELSGEKTGEYFGASLAAADVNNDGIDELFVGSPLYSTPGSGDDGKVYLFMTSGKNKTEILNIKEGIMPKIKIPGGRFGTAIAALGDIDKDGFGDIAIGAPYEDSERGTIYIFYGSPESPYLKYEQRIKATDVDLHLKGFGFSFSRGGDIDNNTYNDLGVGAYLSDNAVILRTSPILRFNSSLRIDSANNKIPMYGDSTTLTVCVRPNEVLENTGVEVILNIDPVFNRGLINGNRRFRYNLTLTARNVKDDCQSFPMTLKNNTKIYKPLEIEISYRIIYPKPKNGQFCKFCPILDFKKPKSYHYIHYQTDCAGQVCKTNLALKGNFTGVRSPFVIGSTNQSSIEMALEVSNSLEASYETYVTITFPSAIKLRQYHQSCDKTKVNSTDVTKLFCEVPYMLNRTTKPFLLNVQFDINNVPWDINQLQVNVSVEGSGEEQNLADDTITLFLELKHVANVSIKGRSSAENIQFAIKQNDSDDYTYHDKTFTHTYTIINNGPSPIHELNLKFLIPHKVKESGQDIVFLNVIPPRFVSIDASGYGKKSSPEYDAVSEKSRDHQYLNLECSLPEVECLVVYYNTTDTIYAKNGVTVSFEITGLLKSLGPHLKQSGVIVRTVGKIENEYILDQDLDGITIFTSEAETVLSGKVVSQERVKDWIIVLAVICGILILAIMCFVLWKLGFFKRNKPPTSEDEEVEKPDAADKMDTEPLYEENP
ncbi:hypothetical protein R5R35_011153 [Gryllus longicercus]|uniref:Integrin alpha second immunoglobulin-like domain-containing protein n=1 Tax=Gryllus longicercus TaxID=2509291 RepID=A0AAN9VKV6_9ORTH